MARSTRPTVSQCFNGREYFIKANSKPTQNGRKRRIKTDSERKNGQGIIVLLDCDMNLIFFNVTVVLEIII